MKSFVVLLRRFWELPVVETPALELAPARPHHPIRRLGPIAGLAPLSRPPQPFPSRVSDNPSLQMLITWNAGKQGLYILISELLLFHFGSTTL